MSRIKMLVMDVDGTMTDGHIYLGPSGEMMKAFNCKDGFGIGRLLPKMGIIPVIISSRVSAVTEMRAKEMHIEELHQGVWEKRKCLEEIAARHGFAREEIAFIGDDLNDWDCLTWCGLTACPQDAVKQVKDVVHYVCPHEGGRGAVRDLIEYIASMEE